MRPVPVVRRPIAFVDQLSERGRGAAGVSRTPGFLFHRIVRGILPRFNPEERRRGSARTVTLASGGVAARAAGGLLDVVGATTATTAAMGGRIGRRTVSPRERNPKLFFWRRSFRRRRDVMGLLAYQSVCVLFLFRNPKEPVPFPVFPMMR